MTEVTPNSGGESSFTLKIDSDIHIQGANRARLKNALGEVDKYDSALAQIDRRVSQASGHFAFDIAEMSDELRDAAYFYLGAATYAFETNPGYRYSTIRFAARRFLLDHNLLPLSTVLRNQGFKISSELSLGEIEPGSIKFQQTVNVVLFVATTVALANDTLQVTQNPAVQHATYEVLNYVDQYFTILGQSGIHMRQTTHQIRPHAHAPNPRIASPPRPKKHSTK